MKKQQAILVIGITAALTVGSILLLTNRYRKRRVMHQKQMIADEGYETAFDILYPLKSQYIKKYKTKF